MFSQLWPQHSSRRTTPLWSKTILICNCLSSKGCWIAFTISFVNSETLDYRFAMSTPLPFYLSILMSYLSFCLLIYYYSIKLYNIQLSCFSNKSSRKILEKCKGSELFMSILNQCSIFINLGSFICLMIHIFSFLQHVRPRCFFSNLHHP